ncbi:MAG: hypothetical protein ACO1NS_15875 [Daejeonella sp.]
MKNLTLNVLAIALSASACTSGTDRTKIKDSVTAATEVVSSECYTGVQGGDSASMKLNTAGNGKVTGELVIKYTKNPANTGTLSGEFKGDTLFADYYFTTGESKTKYKNPMAILRKGDRMILGVGEIESYLGKSYFKKGVPIDFEIAKFKLDKGDCK